jgi:E3 ubiquitin-protein ligase HECTD1
MHFSDANIFTHRDSCTPTTTLQLFKFLQSAQRYTLFEHTKAFSPGYLYYIATGGHLRLDWLNPHYSGLVCVTTSGASPIETYSQIQDVVEHGTAGKFCTTYDPNQETHWVVIDLKDNPPTCPNYYALRGTSEGGKYALRNWLFQGSNDNKNWTTLREHKNDNTIENDGEPHSWEIVGCYRFYRYFRILGVGGQQTTPYRMVGIGGFEIYGKVASRRVN